jgi:hypothetical protein
VLLGGEAVAAQRPRAEDQERKSGHKGHPPGGQRSTEPVPDANGHRMHNRGGDGDTDQHRPRPEPGRKRQRHQLRLIAQFCDEDDAEN